MNEQKEAALEGAPKRSLRSSLFLEAPAVVGFLSVALFNFFEKTLFADLTNPVVTSLSFIYLFGVMLWCAFAAVRHGDAIASVLGEPYGTLILTFSVITIEVSLLASIMLHGDNNPTLARDAMFATLMIVLNGMVGTALLMGALRYWEQEYNLEGARAFLVVIASLSVFALILPNHTQTAPDPGEAPFQAGLFAAITILFYIVFVVIQTMRHRAFFAEPKGSGGGTALAPIPSAIRINSSCRWSPRSSWHGLS